MQLPTQRSNDANPPLLWRAAARTIFPRCEHRLIDHPLVEIVLAGILAAAILLALVIWFSR
jgi:hypothetical protein